MFAATDIDVTSWDWWVGALTGAPLRSLVILAIAFVVRWFARKAIDGFVAGISRVPSEVDVALPDFAGGTRTARTVIGEDPLVAQRRATRAETLGRLAKNVLGVAIWTIATFMILGEFGFDLAPLIASAGIAGVALGFGAQSVVADFLSGVFMLFEDQYGVGDVVDLGEATGTVENVQLRVTRVRSVDGVVWYVRNGEVVRVGNMSQHWSRAILDIGVAYDADLPRVKELMLGAARDLAGEDDWSADVLDDPQVWGIEQLAADSVVVRLVLKVSPGRQFAVARELRERIKERFDAEGVEIPFPQRTVWVRPTAGDDPGPT
jgi:small-conductance mechanosensitive channel